MFFASNLDTVTHGIQLAVAPVFLLTAVAAMIGTVARPCLPTNPIPPGANPDTFKKSPHHAA
jgi:hypothetical protein